VLPFRLDVDPPETPFDEPPEPEREVAVDPVLDADDDGVRRSAPVRSCGGGGGGLTRDSTRDPESPDELDPPDPDELPPDEVVSVRGTA
jgi:hypothetical protein